MALDKTDKIGAGAATVAEITTEHGTSTVKRRAAEKKPWEYFFGEQKVEEYRDKSTDCHLICSDGFVPAHSLVLQLVSPFFDALFAGQCCPCFTPRPITMQDYTVSEVRKLVELIYTGTVTLKSQAEVDMIKEMVRSFQIMATASLESTSEVIKPARGRPTLAEDKGALFYPFDKKKTVRENLDLLKIRPTINITRVNPTKMIPIPLNRNPTAGKVEPFKPTGTTPVKKAESESDDDEKSLQYDREHFLEEAKKCQYCNTMHKTAAAASSCLTSHNRLRCYFCFKVVRNTEKLFQHFNEKHKKAGRENCLLCPLCETIVPFKSVSCHVISLHLSENNKNPPSNRGNAVRVGRPALNSMPAPAPPAARGSPTITGVKRPAEKDENKKGGDGDDDLTKKTYALTDLKVKFSKNSICGKVRVFQIGKKRRIETITTTTAKA